MISSFSGAFGLVWSVKVIEDDTEDSDSIAPYVYDVHLRMCDLASHSHTSLFERLEEFRTSDLLR